VIETFTLYDGEIELIFNSGNHQYKVVRTKTGRSFKPDSVTRICGIIDKSGPLINWAIGNTVDYIRSAVTPEVEHAESFLEEIYAQAKKESQRKKSEAAERGTVVHSILSGDTPDSDIPNSKAERAKEWLRENNVTFTSIERPIYSRRYRYCGRLDGVGLVNGKTSLLDWKTGKSGLYPEFRLQTAAYCSALEEELGERIEQRVILHLTEEACVPHYFPRELLRKDFLAFLGAQRLHQQIKKIEKELKVKP
jgi:hypothetical protein